jgi:hypothetical protein
LQQRLKTRFLRVSAKPILSEGKPMSFYVGSPRLNLLSSQLSQTSQSPQKPEPIIITVQRKKSSELKTLTFDSKHNVKDILKRTGTILDKSDFGNKITLTDTMYKQLIKKLEHEKITYYAYDFEDVNAQFEDATVIKPPESMQSALSSLFNNDLPDSKVLSSQSKLQLLNEYYGDAVSNKSDDELSLFEEAVDLDNLLGDEPSNDPENNSGDNKSDS